MKKIYVLLANGFELLEASGPITIMKRAGIEVITLSLNDTLEVDSSAGLTLKADKLLNETDYLDGDGIFLPGGAPGYHNLFASDLAMNLTKYYIDNNKYLISICGAPSTFARKRYVDGRKITLHPACHNLIGDYCTVVSDSLCIDGNIITATGAGISVDLGLTVVEILEPSKLEEVKKQLTLIKYY